MIKAVHPWGLFEAVVWRFVEDKGRVKVDPWSTHWKHSPQQLMSHMSVSFSKGPEREMDAIQAKEEVKKAREEDEEELLMGKFGGQENSFQRFHRRDEF